MVSFIDLELNFYFLLNIDEIYFTIYGYENVLFYLYGRHLHTLGLGSLSVFSGRPEKMDEFVIFTQRS